MKANTLASCRRSFGCEMAKSKALTFYSLVLITLLHVLSCDGQGISTAMFEIPSNDQTQYMLKDCRKMTAGDFDCKCEYLGRDCQQDNVTKCRNCSCLDGSTRIFYVKKRYGALCLSVNNLLNAASFGEKIVIYNHIYKVCAQVSDQVTPSIEHTKDCTFKDPRNVWIWTPGNLLMNLQTSQCLQTNQTKSNIYLPMSVRRCDSSNEGQKWKCNDKLWWGVSFPRNLTNITHATRYYSKNPALLARAVAKKIDTGNVWAVFPSSNQSVCTARKKEEIFYLNNENTEISQIDLVPLCPRDGCARKLLTPTTTDNLSNCSIVWNEEWSQKNRPFTVENQEDGIYFKWRSNPYTTLGGRILDLTLECVRNNSKFEEFLFGLRVKDVILKRLQKNYHIKTDDKAQSSVQIVDLDKDCAADSLCSRRLTGVDKPMAVCVILWNESSLSRLDYSSVGIENVTGLLTLRKEEERFSLQWNLRNAQLLSNATFNLTVLCYDDKQENITSAEKSSLVFQTRYGFIPNSKSSDSSSDNSVALYLAIVLPIVIVLLLIIILVIIIRSIRRKRKMNKSMSKSTLHNNVENRQYSNGSVNSGLECKSEDNPVYEQCESTAHPTVTIARNKIYEAYNEKKASAVSDIYENPLPSVTDRQDQFQKSTTTSKPSPKPKSHLPPNAGPKPKPSKESQPVKKPLTTPHYKIPKVVEPPHEKEEDIYDQPLGFIPSLTRDVEQEMIKDEIPLQDFGEQRIVSTYEKALPDSPKDSGIYEYARRDEIPTSPTRCPAEKPFEYDAKRDHGGSERSATSGAGSYVNDAPFYDVLEY